MEMEKLYTGSNKGGIGYFGKHKPICTKPARKAKKG